MQDWMRDDTFRVIHRIRPDVCVRPSFSPSFQSYSLLSQSPSHVPLPAITIITFNDRSAHTQFPPSKQMVSTPLFFLVGDNKTFPPFFRSLLIHPHVQDSAIAFRERDSKTTLVSSMRPHSQTLSLQTPCLSFHVKHKHHSANTVRTITRAKLFSFPVEYIIKSNPIKSKAFENVS